MKTKIPLLQLMAVLLSLGTHGQITLENVYSTGIVNNQNFSVVKLSNSGHKYVNPDLANGKITLYNLDHTVFKILTYTPVVYPAGGIDYYYFISEDLFDTNPGDVEFLIRGFDYSNSISTVCIYEENGTLLFKKDSVNLNGFEYSWVTPSVSYTPGGVKLRLSSQVTDSVYIYVLPGILVCSDCTNGQVTGLVHAGTGISGKASPYPNPAVNAIKIKYALPLGTPKAKISFYNVQGKEIRTMEIDNYFDEITIDKGTLGISSGVVFYKIYSAGVIFSADKIVFE